MTLARYILGFVLSIALTLFAAGLVYYPFASPLLAAALVSLALVQLIVQLIFFMHLGQSKKSGGDVTVFALTLIIIAILVGGTLWIMQNLESQHAMPELFENNVIAPHYQLE